MKDQIHIYQLRCPECVSERVCWSQRKLTVTVVLCQFEWAWQHPHSSKRLPHVSRRSRKESSLEFHWRVVTNMLRVAPWSRLPLTARWLKQEYRMDFGPGLQPPLHMPIAFGSVRVKKRPPLPSQEEEEEEASRCFLCKGLIEVGSPQGSASLPLHICV